MCDSKMYSTRNGLQLQQVYGAQLRAAARVEVVLGIRIRCVLDASLLQRGPERVLIGLGTRAERGGWVGAPKNIPR